MKTTAAISSELAHYYQNAAHANVGDAGGLLPSSVAGSFYISLHTASPGITGTQATNAATYTGYARVAVPRTGAGFTVAAPNVSNTAAIFFPGCSGGTNIITHWGLGTDLTGAGNLLRFGPISTAFKGFTAALTDNITVPNHTFVADDRVVFYADGEVPFAGGLVQGTAYYVLAAGLSGDVFQVSLTSAGSPVSISSTGAGICAEASPLTITTGMVPSIAAGALVIIEH